MVRTEDACEIIKYALQNEIKVYLDGGWGVDAIKELCTLDGIGKWTAEMVLIFSMNRMDILSYGDFGIKNGIKILYNKEKITKDLFEKYRKRYSPYGSVASIYLWEVSGGCLNDEREG